MALGVAALPAAAASQSAGPTTASFTTKPLPFDPAALPGLSAKLLTSHHDNDYAGAVKRLGAIRTELRGSIRRRLLVSRSTGSSMRS